MNQEQKLWLRISQAGQVTEQIEVLDFRRAIRVIFESFIAHNARKILMNVEISNQPLRDTLLNREQQAEQQLMAGALTDQDEIIYPPDVTLGECELAWASESGQLMFKYQRPESRIGIDPEVLNQLRNDWESNFPRVAAHGPLWTT